MTTNINELVIHPGLTNEPASNNNTVKMNTNLLILTKTVYYT